MKKETSYLINFILLCVLAAVMLSVAVLTSFNYESDKLEITFLDVGQADCVYIKTPDNHRILIDGGEYGSYRKYIKKFLVRKFVLHVDIGVATHFHSDHAGGITDMAECNAVDKVVFPRIVEKSEVEEKLINACSESDIPCEEAGVGNVIYDGSDGVKIKVLFPNKGIIRNRGEDYSENNNSLVIKLEYKDKKFLFTGDIEGDAEDALCDVEDLSADVLKVPHHGSANSSTERFLRCVHPEYAVISCGKNNSYGFPTDEVLKRLDRSQIKYFRTDLNGDITFIVDENGSMEIKKEE